MNTYMVLGLVIVLVCLVTGYFALTGTTVIQAVIMFGSAGAVIMACSFLVIQKKIYPSIFKVVVRVYAERYGGMTIIEQTRAKIVKDKKGYEYLETLSGKKYKMVNRKYIMKGNDPYVDIFDTKIQQFPITMNMDNLEEIHKEIISENQRAWFADQVIPNIKEITKPPMDNKLQIATMISLMSVVIIFVMGMAMGPDFMTKMSAFWNERYAQLDAQNQVMYDKLAQSPIIVRCEGGTGIVEKPETPPS